MFTQYKIISVGGSIIIPQTGFAVEFLKRFKNLIMARVKKGDRFILVVGGGSTCRQYQTALSQAHHVSKEDLDWLGIYSTWFNAEFVRLLFGKLAYGEIVKNPTKRIKTNQPIIVAGGWQPGCSTDLDAVSLAETYGAKELVNLSNIDYVYTADPRKIKSAKPIKEMAWSQLKQIVGTRWKPGANLPFDPKAIQLAAKLGLKLIFVKGTDLVEVKKALLGLKIKGTIITE